jgi:hypothetical protein
MTRRLKRISPVKFGLISGIIYGLISLVFIPFFLLSFGIALLAPHSQQNSALPQELGVAFGALLCILLPVMYAVMGGLFGMLAAWLYNVAASWVGGIEFEVK